MSARTPPRPTPGRRVSVDLADSTRQLVRDAALLLLLSKLDLLSVATRVLLAFRAGSLVTVRPVKYGISSLVAFVSERLHCQLAQRR